MAQILNSEKVNVAIIGAGCAGLAAASLLASKDIRVTVFEAAPQLGGRARGVDYKGVKLDNGQHIMLGAYTETLALLSRAGVQLEQALQRISLSMHMQALNQLGLVSLTTCRHLPAPLHLLFGLLLAKGLSVKDKYLAISIMARLHLKKFKLKHDLPLAEFLLQQRQSTTLTQYLWEPLCLAALNTPLWQASSQVFLNVLRDSFTKKKTDSDFLLPKQDLSSLLSDPLSQYIQQYHGQMVHATVQSIQANNAGFTINTHEAHDTFSHVIIAVAPHQLKSVLPTQLSAASLLANFSYQPITTVYLQFEPTKRLPQVMQGMVNSISQWVFDKGQLNGQHGLIAVIISASGKHEAMTQSALAQSVIAELNNLFPDLGAPIWHKVITEKRATFSCNAGLQRPSNHTEIANLYLAGDFTAGDYPATIEGAVRSGLKAAGLILSTSNNHLI